ncbi:MAG: hypothetical protein JNJ50_32340 [Acidobacteria bacterium]|nr:hypothetical protein [Acidobacteriota bacterium]
MQKPLRLNAITRGNRHQVVAEAKDAISASGGWVLDFKQFSNLSFCLNFELPSRSVTQLRAALAQIDLQLTEASEQLLAEFCAPCASEDPRQQQAASDLTGTLQITFVHNEPELRVTIPAIPG